MKMWKELEYIREEGEEAKGRARGRIDSLVVWEGIPILYASGITKPSDIVDWLKKWNIHLTRYQVVEQLVTFERSGMIEKLDS